MKTCRFRHSPITNIFSDFYVYYNLKILGSKGWTGTHWPDKWITNKRSTVQHRELCSMSQGSLDGREFRETGYMCMQYELLAVH